jgi:two-component system, OmpR family, phosphate regulon sensor histidine kinase PhoR
MKKKNAVFFYLLGAYVVLQFIWWGYHLIELTKELDSKQSIVSNRVFMIMSEGFVFFTILLIGLWKVRSSIKKELKYSVRQNNFLLSVTHELKTPLAANKLYLQTILKRELEPQKRNELIQKAVSENLRLEVMVDNILNASRIENNAIHIHKEEINLSQLLNEIAARFNKIIQKEVIKSDIEPGISIQGDKFMIETSVNNLLENAIKYAGIEESIYLYLKETEEDEVIFGVKDQGLGVPLNYQKEIFEKFVRNENEETRSQKGTGLGLFITAEFIKIHGGKISYKDNSPAGANFEIIL